MSRRASDCPLPDTQREKQQIRAETTARIWYLSLLLKYINIIMLKHNLRESNNSSDTPWVSKFNTIKSVFESVSL